MCWIPPSLPCEHGLLGLFSPPLTDKTEKRWGPLVPPDVMKWANHRPNQWLLEFKEKTNPGKKQNFTCFSRGMLGARDHR